MAQDALKVNELSRLALSSNGSAVTLTDEVSAHAEHSPAPATPEKQLLEKPSWIRSLTGTRLRSLSVDNHNPWTSNAQTSFTLSDLAPQPLEISLPPESNPFASPMKEDAPRASPARARARSEVPSVETSPLKTPRMGLSPLRATGLRMSPSPLKSSPLAMLAKTWSEKVRERDDGL